VRVMQIIGNSVVGGAESHLLDLVEGLGLLGVECVVVCPRPGPLTETLTSRGVPVTCLEMVLPWPGDEYGLDWSVVERLAAHLQAYRPDVVHSHLYPAHLHGTLAAHMVGTSAIVHSAHTLVVRAGDVLLSRLTTVRTITMAHAAAQLLVHAGVPHDRITVIYNGVGPEHHDSDPAAEQAARATVALPRGPVVGVVSRLSPEKGVDVLLRAVPAVAQAYPSLTVLIVGDGPQRAELQRLAHTLHLGDTVRFLGTRRDVAALNRLFDVFVLPSREEVCPMALLEAMAAGCAVVATVVGGATEVVAHGATGWLVPPDDATALAIALTELLRAPARRVALGQAARETIRTRFTCERMVRETWAFYQTLLAAHSRGSEEQEPLAWPRRPGGHQRPR